MSAITDGSEVLRVLITMHEQMDTLDFAGPLEVLGHARHSSADQNSKAFKCTFVASSQHTNTAQGARLAAHIDYEEAHERLADFDVLLVPGGNPLAIVDKDAEPIPLVAAFAKLQEEDPSRERTLFSVSTGSLFLAKAGVLQGMAATTHPSFYTKLEILCQGAARKGELEQTNVMEERYVVNNARFDLGDNLDENPWVLTAKPDGRRKSIARKGSNAVREARRRESIARRAQIRLGGLRIITAGGVSCGIDAALYLVAALVSHDAALEAGRAIQYDWKKGVTIDATDV